MPAWDLRSVVQRVMWVALAAFLVLLAVPGDPLGAGIQLFNVGTQLLPAMVCWLAVRRAGVRRREVTALAVGVSAFAAGNVVLAAAQARGVTLPVPSWADLGYMSFYPAALVAIGLAARRDHRDLGGAVWLDSALGGLAAASAVAVLLKPAFSRTGHEALSASVSLAYPTGDLLLVFAIVATAALREWRLDRRWLPLLAGIATFTAADLIYDLQIAAHSYVVGTPLDGLWALGLCLMTLWTAPSPVTATVRTRHFAALAVSAASTAVSLAVLVAGTVTPIARVATVLAALAIAGSIVRTQHAFRIQQRLSDLRREAETFERLLAAQDVERARIADDVHDDSLQALAAVDIRLGALRRRLRGVAPEEVEGLDAVTDAVHQASGRLRNLLFELETPAIEATLPDALRDAAAHLFDETSTRYSVVEVGRAGLTEATRVVAYRIAREALVNVLKHAQASQVVVTVDAQDSGVRVDIVDDGVGVTAARSSSPSRRRHSGVIGMRDRAAAAGGWWSSESGPSGEGTRVSYFVPTATTSRRASDMRPPSTVLHASARALPSAASGDRPG